MRVKATRKLLDFDIKCNEMFDLDSRVTQACHTAMNNGLFLGQTESQAQEYFRKYVDAYCGNEEKAKTKYIATLLELIIGANSPLETIICTRYASYSRLFTSEDFKDNPYYKNIKIPEYKDGNVELFSLEFEPLELGMYDIGVMDSAFSDIPAVYSVPRLALFKDTVTYPAFKKDDDIWMSITPNEIFTMKKPIEEATGDVLTIGLGMGYYAYMISLKDDVKSVTIVENDENVIKLFKTHILPQFEHKEKIHIIHADGIKYLEDLEDGKFNYCFVDIWKGVTWGEEMDLYFSTMERGRRLKKTKTSYWIEDSFLQCLLPVIYMTFMEDLYKSLTRQYGVPPQELMNIPEIPSTEEYKTAYGYVRKLFKDTSIECIADVMKLLNINNLRKAVRKTKLRYEDFK